jgi:hypothetical protein
MLRRAFLFACLTLAAACGGDSTGPGASPVGSYSLRTLNGQIGPWTISQTATQRIEWLSSTVTLNGDGTYSENTQLRTQTSSSTTTSTVAALGTYIVNGNAVTTTTTSGGRLTYAWSGNTLTATVTGAVAVFQR